MSAYKQEIKDTDKCRICNVNLTNDNWRKSNRIHHDYMCKQCSVLKAHSYYIKYRKQIIQKSKLYYRSHITKCRERSKYLTPKNKYGLTPQDINKMLLDQKGLCVYCNGPLGKEQYKKGIGLDGWVIEHDHKTQKVIGIIHQKCNMITGFSDYDSKLLRQISVNLDRLFR